MKLLMAARAPLSVYSHAEFPVLGNPASDMGFVYAQMLLGLTKRSRLRVVLSSVTIIASDLPLLARQAGMSAPTHYIDICWSLYDGPLGEIFLSCYPNGQTFR
jgi:hypothetical protein